MATKSHCDFCDSTEKVHWNHDIRLKLRDKEVRLNLTIKNGAGDNKDVCARCTAEALHLAGIIAAGDFDNVKRAGTKSAAKESRVENTPQTDQAPISAE